LTAVTPDAALEAFGFHRHGVATGPAKNWLEASVGFKGAALAAIQGTRMAAESCPAIRIARQR